MIVVCFGREAVIVTRLVLEHFIKYEINPHDVSLSQSGGEMFMVISYQWIMSN
jgi:hypothetical protein